MKLHVRSSPNFKKKWLRTSANIFLFLHFRPRYSFHIFGQIGGNNSLEGLVMGF